MYSSGMIDEYKERVKIKYDELETEVEAVEEEWKKYKDSFVGVAEEMCGRTSGKGGSSKNQKWWTDEVARAVDEKREVWKKIETIRDRGEQPSVAMKHEKTEVVEITDREMRAAMKKVKKGKATGLDEMVDEIRAEMLDLAGDVGVNWTRRLLNSCLTEGKIPI